MSCKLYIPPLGGEITLAENWDFELYPEGRNEKMGKVCGWFDESQPYRSRWMDTNKPTPPKSYPVTIPAGTKLHVSRYYIRQGQSTFDSITFTIKKGQFKSRFWAKLSDVNNIVMYTI